MNDSLHRLLSDRYSCRGFLRQPVPRDLLEQILALAQRTPSWCNAQPWQVHLTSGTATNAFREVMLKAADTLSPSPDFAWPVEYKGRYDARRKACGWGLYASVGIARGDRVASARQARENFRFFGAPHVAMVTTERALGVYGAVDCGAYVNNLMLAAATLGVGSIAQAALGSYPEVVREFFGLPPERLVVCGVSLGFEDNAHPANGFRTERAPLDEAVSWHE